MKKILFLFTILALTSKLCYAQNVVAGIEFGKTSYEEAAPKLIKKFGEPSVQKLNDTFAFKDVSYAGLMFDNIFFFFENTAESNVLKHCAMYAEFDSEEEANEFREKIVKKLGKKYKIKTNNNPDSKITIKEYLVGTSPTNPSEPYITISTYKYKSGSCATGIVYGPFKYNDETF